MNKWFVLALALSVTGPVPAGISIENTEKILAETWDGNATVELPVIAPSEAPVIDGRIDEDEWRRGAKLAGFIRHSKGLLPEQRGFVYLMTDPEYLYVGVRTTAPNNDPGGGLLANATERDGSVYSDDSVELILHPQEKDKDSAYHIIINNNGAIFDRKHSYPANHADLAWNISGMKVGTRAESGWWDLEVKIPLSEIGSPGYHFKMNVARNWRNGIGSTAIIPSGDHLDAKRMLTVIRAKQAPTFRMDGLGSPEEGEWQVELNADNPTGRPLILAAVLRKFTWPKIDGKTQVKIETEKLGTVEILPGKNGSLKLDFDTTDPYIRKLSVALIDAESGKVLCRRLISAQREVFAGNHPATGTFEMNNAGNGVCWYYPTYDKAALRINVKNGLRAAGVTASFGGETVAVPRHKNHYRGVIPVPPGAGKHPLTVTVTDENGKAHRFENLFSVTRTIYPWENNRLGMDRVVLPPFTPVKAEANRVDLLLRSHRVNAQGVWDSLSADGVEMLAEPMYWEIRVDGKTERLSGALPRFAATSEGCEALAETAARTDGGISVNSKVKFEYDGFFWSDVRLDRVDGKVVEQMTLVIPLKDAEVPLFHAVSNTIRSNPGGAVPQGEGEVWNGAKLRRPTDSIHSQLVPYIWLGGIERGLCYFTDSSYGYKLQKDRGALRLVRRDGVLRVEIDIINRPVRLANGHSFSFGLQATPVKPVDRGARRQTYDASGVGIKGMRNIQSLYYGLMGYPSGWSKAPAGGDYGMMRFLAALSRSGNDGDVAGETAQFALRHDAAVLSAISSLPKPRDLDYSEHYKTVRHNFIKINMGDGRGESLPSKYSDPRLIFMADETVQYFKSEWWINNTGYFGGWRSYPVPSNLDYMVDAYNRELENGMHGIYLDDMFLIPNTNPDTAARIDGEGEIHSEIGILALRELVKRLAVLQHRHGLYPRQLEVHMTNAQLVPCFSFATAQLAWESMFGETPHQERYSLDSIQVEGIGNRLGLASIALGGILRQTTPWDDWPKLRAKLTRSFLALTLPHDVKAKNRMSPDDIDWRTVVPVYEKMSEFGYWQEDCRFVPYWQKDPAIGGGSESLLVSSYRRPGEVLLVIGNLGKETDFALTLDRGKLGLAPDSPAFNLESGEKVDLSSLRIGTYDMLLIRVGK